MLSIQIKQFQFVKRLNCIILILCGLILSPHNIFSADFHAEEADCALAQDVAKEDQKCILGFDICKLLDEDIDRLATKILLKVIAKKYCLRPFLISFKDNKIHLIGIKALQKILHDDICYALKSGMDDSVESVSNKIVSDIICVVYDLTNDACSVLSEDISKIILCEHAIGRSNRIRALYDKETKETIEELRSSKESQASKELDVRQSRKGFEKRSRSLCTCIGRKEEQEVKRNRGFSESCVSNIKSSFSNKNIMRQLKISCSNLFESYVGRVEGELLTQNELNELTEGCPHNRSLQDVKKQAIQKIKLKIIGSISEALEAEQPDFEQLNGLISSYFPRLSSLTAQELNAVSKEFLLKSYMKNDTERRVVVSETLTHYENMLRRANEFIRKGPKEKLVEEPREIREGQFEAIEAKIEKLSKEATSIFEKLFEEPTNVFLAKKWWCIFNTMIGAKFALLKRDISDENKLQTELRQYCQEKVVRYLLSELENKNKKQLKRFEAVLATLKKASVSAKAVEAMYDSCFGLEKEELRGHLDQLYNTMLEAFEQYELIVTQKIKLFLEEDIQKYISKVQQMNIPNYQLHPRVVERMREELGNPSEQEVAYHIVPTEMICNWLGNNASKNIEWRATRGAVNSIGSSRFNNMRFPVNAKRLEGCVPDHVKQVHKLIHGDRFTDFHYSQNYVPNSTVYAQVDDTWYVLKQLHTAKCWPSAFICDNKCYDVYKIEPVLKLDGWVYNTDTKELKRVCWTAAMCDDGLTIYHLGKGESVAGNVDPYAADIAGAQEATHKVFESVEYEQDMCNKEIRTSCAKKGKKERSRDYKKFKTYWDKTIDSMERYIYITLTT